MHWLVTGVTGCGKSRIMREVVLPVHRYEQRSIVVLDPLLQRWPANIVTNDVDRFIRIAKASIGLVMVVDEFRFWAKDHKKLMQLEWLFTIGRNHGHLCYALAQRLMMVPPNVREQCSNAVTFAQPASSLIHIAEQFNAPDVLRAQTLPAGHALVSRPFQPTREIICPWVSRKKLPTSPPRIASEPVRIADHGKRQPTPEAPCSRPTSSPRSSP